MSQHNQYYKRYWDKKAFRYEKRALNKNSPSYLVCMKYIKKAVEDNAHVIDLGCGTGIMREVLEDKISSYLGIDISSGMISMAKGKNAHGDDNTTVFKKGDMHNTHLDNHTADNVLLCNVLEYSQNPELVLMEAKRLTKPNGLVITSTNCYGSVRNPQGVFRSIGILVARIFKTIPFIRLYTFKSLRRILESSGMVIIAEKKLNHMGKNKLFAVLKT